MIIPIIAGNWKMNKTVTESLDFVNRLKKHVVGMKDRQILIAPSYPALHSVGLALKDSGIALAAQNMSDRREGAFTGEVSARMLVDAGCSYVIIGHSERRMLFGESNETVHAKIGIALSIGLQPILCIGETILERETGRTFKVIEKQIKEGLNQIETDDISSIIIAYEPVWAIGTGKTATPEQAGEAHTFIRSLLSEIYGREKANGLPVIYGGSVSPDNIGKLMAQRDINGALVGGASMDADSFSRVIDF